MFPCSPANKRFTLTSKQKWLTDKSCSLGPECFLLVGPMTQIMTTPVFSNVIVIQLFSNVIQSLLSLKNSLVATLFFYFTPFCLLLSPTFGQVFMLVFVFFSVQSSVISKCTAQAISTMRLIIRLPEILQVAWRYGLSSYESFKPGAIRDSFSFTSDIPSVTEFHQFFFLT